MGGEVGKDNIKETEKKIFSGEPLCWKWCVWKMNSEDGFLRLANNRLSEELMILLWAYCKEQIWLQLAGHLTNELCFARMICFLFMLKTEPSKPLIHPPAAYILDKCGKVRQGDIYS